MEVSTCNLWQPDDYCVDAAGGLAGDVAEVACVVYERVCRITCDRPGFCLVDLGCSVDSGGLRATMVALKQSLQQIHRDRYQRELVYLSAGRFDQQETTKFHRDGGPEECMLMLGYEPSEVSAELAMADYSKCAADNGLTPAEFLDRHNPMFAEGEELLQPYTSPVGCFNNRHFQIVMINNSMTVEGDGRWQGVLHTAKILNPDPALRRVVNSTMIVSVAIGDAGGISDEAIQDFVSTSVVRRRGYDNLAAVDDV
jgi:hypothetical protein